MDGETSHRLKTSTPEKCSCGRGNNRWFKHRSCPDNEKRILSGNPLSRDRVVPMPPPGVTARNTPECEPASFQSTVATNRLHSISRTARIIAAGRRKQGRQQPPVEPNQSQKNPLHSESLCAALRGSLCKVSQRTD